MNHPSLGLESEKQSCGGGWVQGVETSLRYVHILARDPSTVTLTEADTLLGLRTDLEVLLGIHRQA